MKMKTEKCPRAGVWSELVFFGVAGFLETKQVGDTKPTNKHE